MGVEGGEVVVGDLGVCLGDHAQEGGFTHVGEAHQTHVCQQLQLQNHIVALAGETGLGEAGHLTGGGGEMLVAPAAATALAEDEGLIVQLYIFQMQRQFQLLLFGLFQLVRFRLNLM